MLYIIFFLFLLLLIIISTKLITKKIFVFDTLKGSVTNKNTGDSLSAYINFEILLNRYTLSTGHESVYKFTSKLIKIKKNQFFVYAIDTKKNIKCKIFITLLGNQRVNFNIEYNDVIYEYQTLNKEIYYVPFYQLQYIKGQC